MRLFLLLPMLLWSCNTATSDATTTPPIDTATAAAAVLEPDISGNPTPAVDADWEIIPGKKVGNTVLGDDPATLLQGLGQPDASDAAMGKAWLVWDGKNTENTLAVFTTYADSNMMRKAIRQIRVTSPRFQTVEGLHTGSNKAEVKRVFPKLQQAENIYGDVPPRYDVISKGISFEFSGNADYNACTAIMVYPPGGSPTAYLPIPEKR